MASRGRPRNFDRDEALAKATALFWERGYDGTSISNLEKAMSLNPPSIYAAFGSKDKLFSEALKQYLKVEGAVIVGAIESAPSGAEAARAMLFTSAREFARKDQPKGCMIVLDALHDHGTNSLAHAELTLLRQKNIMRLAKKFEADVENRDLPNGRDWVQLATFFVTVQQGMAIRARDGAESEELMAIAECALAALPKTLHTS